MANPDDIELDQGQNSMPSPEKSTDAKSNHYEETPSPSPSAPGPTAWQFETGIPGGYKQSRMLRFQNPSTMYKMINLFAGIAICFYGYDQGVMSLVNQNLVLVSLSNHITVEMADGVGSIDCVVPVWSAEVSSHSARGAFLALEFVMVCPSYHYQQHQQ